MSSTTSTVARIFPDKVRILPSTVAQRHLTMPVLKGDEAPAPAPLDQASSEWEMGIRADAQVLRDLVEEVMARFGQEDRTRADAWLAPRLHATLRLSRREAADAGIWNYLAFRVAPDYVVWRHLPMSSKTAPTSSVNPLRFVGTFHRQAFSRLWWVAELFRNGADYGPAETACGNQDVLNTALRLDIVHHRPTAQAIVRMLGTGREVNALVKAINAAGSTLLFEALAPDVNEDVDAHRAWVEDAGTSPIPYERLPEGPDDGTIDPGAVSALLPLFAQLFSTSPVRGRESGEA